MNFRKNMLLRCHKLIWIAKRGASLRVWEVVPAFQNVSKHVLLWNWLFKNYMEKSTVFQKMDFAPIKRQVFFHIFYKNSDFSWISQKNVVVAMSQTNMNCQAGSITLKNMFYRDSQALVLYILRGTCARGDIWIDNEFGFPRYIVFHFCFKRHTFFWRCYRNLMF